MFFTVNSTLTKIINDQLFIFFTFDIYKDNQL